MWACIAPEAKPECASEPPDVGMPCSNDSLRCEYCSDGEPIARICVGGAIDQWRDDALRACR